MSDRLVFVSCGQLTEQEKALGVKVCALIDGVNGFKAYYAQEVQNLGALSEHVLDAIRRCSGAVIILHKRGQPGAPCNSSLWINQEVAILAYRQHFENRTVPVIAFKERDVEVRGAMTALILNPVEITSHSQVLEDVHAWVRGDGSSGPASEQELFDAKWATTTTEDRRILRALVGEGGRDIKEATLRAGHGIESAVLRVRCIALVQAGLVRRAHNAFDGDEVSLHPQWEWYVIHALANANG